MQSLQICLFGKLRILYGSQSVVGLDQRKAQDLFCYLLIHRNQLVARETLAGILWGDFPTAHSKKYLRQALWQLNSVLESQLGPQSAKLLVVDAEWVSLQTATQVWLDAAELEDAFNSTQGCVVQDWDEFKIKRLHDAVQLYQGDLLAGWYQDWCLFERERLQNIYLALLDRLVTFCEVRHKFKEGIGYCNLILRYDRAHERTHRRLMLLSYFDGDRTAALRQYQRCVQALQEELGVEPSDETNVVYKQICRDRLTAPLPTTVTPNQSLGAEPTPVSDLLAHLKQLQQTLANVQSQMSNDIQAIEHSLTNRH